MGVGSSADTTGGEVKRTSIKRKPRPSTLDERTYLDRSHVGDAMRPTLAALIALSRLRASGGHATVDVAIGKDGQVYASISSTTMDRAALNGQIEMVGRYNRTAKLDDVACDIEYALESVDKR